ncbi:hypothetical protein A9Q99_17515 [Gammaproteobacteria bacterium 45_16_T64]|nr:hypothetical protein A9Q99_17515 [Gammaproteobacteria bacterium 45_16_T64]
MSNTETREWLINVRISLLILLAALMCLSTTANATELRLNPAKVKGIDACGECHKETVKAWKKTHHSTTFADMPRSDEAREIADKMGIKRIKSESDCLTCHFTVAKEKGKEKPIAGISCESCHSAGKDWIDIHSDFGGKDVKAENETPAHKVERYKKSEAAGMIRPGNLYALAKNCYSCHTVPNEKLVNVGGHEAGSNFELVRWSQGEVRHNLWYSDDNTEADLNRRRMLYVIGKMLDLEYALRGVAKATKKAQYAVAMAKRAKRALAFLKKIDKTVDNNELTKIIAIAKKAKVSLNNEAVLTKAANSISAQAKMFSDKYDGSTLSGVDGALPAPEKYRGTVFGE